MMAKVSKIMITNVPTLKKEAKVEDAAKLLAQHNIGCVVIVEGRKPIGIVTELDFLRQFSSKSMSMKDPISKLMTSQVTSMDPDTKIDEALKIIDSKRYRRYPVVANGELLGVVTKKDIVNAVSDNIKLHRRIQDAVLVLFVLFEFFVFAFADYVSKYLSK